MTKDDGGLAFPGRRGEQIQETAGGNFIGHPVDYPGLTKREYFAAQALVGIMSGLMSPSTDGSWHGWKLADIASEAFSIADAMLAAGKE
jgi:hypothetical protein